MRKLKAHAVFLALSLAALWAQLGMAATAPITAQNPSVAVLYNATINSSGSQAVVGFVGGEADLLINIGTRTAGSLTFTVADSDPQNPTTAITGGTSVTTPSLSLAGTAVLTGVPVHSSALLISWTSSSANFSGVYVTLAQKQPSPEDPGGIVTAPGFQTTGTGCYTLANGCAFCPGVTGSDGTINGNMTIGANDGGTSITIPNAINFLAPNGTNMFTYIDGACTANSFGVICTGGEWIFSGGLVTDGFTINSLGVFNTNGILEYGGTTGWALENNGTYGSYAFNLFSDLGVTSIFSISPTGVVNANSGEKIGVGSTVTSRCVSTQGGCSMASASTCTVACTGCTTSSSCFSGPQSNAATSDAVGVRANCATGTVTLTAITASVGTETFNVMCFN